MLRLHSEDDAPKEPKDLAFDILNARSTHPAKDFQAQPNANLVKVEPDHGAIGGVEERVEGVATE